MKMIGDNDVNSVFEKNTILQVEEVLSKTRNDIERKKEDLRIMVGERYRDLIEAADTIASMQKSADAICSNIENMESLCESLKQRGLIGFKTRSNASTAVFSKISKSEYHYSIAMQVKLLVDVPEILWGLTESKNFLDATQLFLLSQYAHTALQLSSNANMVMSGFPVISRQWSNISQFKSTIMKGCNKKIKYDIDDYEAVLNAVAAVMLLEGCTLHQVLLKVLELRKSALLTSLKIKPSVVAKVQLTEFVVLFMSSLEIINYLFQIMDSSTSKPMCLVEEKLKLVSGQMTNGSDYTSPISLLDESSVGLSFLPKSVIEFRPTLRSDFETLDEVLIKKEVDDWLKSVIDLSSSSINKLLSYTSSIKALSFIRNGIGEIENSRMEQDLWKRVVRKLLTAPCISPGQTIIKDQLLERCKKLIAKELENAKDSVLKMVQNLAIELVRNPRTSQEEGDITSFVWSEASSDLPDQVGWMNTSALPSNQEKSGLFYKSRGYTKRIQTVCKSLNYKLNAILEDLLYFAPAAFLKVNSKKKEAQSNFEKSDAEDYNQLLQFLETETSKVFIACLNRLIAIAEEHSKEEALNQYEEDKKFSSPPTVLVVISRLCHAFSDVCPKLKMCAGASLLGDYDTARRVNLGVQPDTESWISLKKEMLSCSTQLMKKFLTFATESVSTHLKKELLKPIQSNETESSLVLFSTWESIAIEEEEESGKVIRSSISVPAYPSPALSLALNNVCSSVNCVSAHTVDRSSLKELEHQLCIRLLSNYEELKDCVDIINQATALQLIFDLKLIQILLIPRDAKSSTDRVSKLVQIFEKIVDPFDLDVFHPHISSRVKIAGTRLQVLLGIVLPKDRQPLITKGSLSSGSSITNNALLVVPSVDIPRFSNVPLPVLSSKRKAAATSADHNMILGSSSYSKSNYKNASANFKTSGRDTSGNLSDSPTLSTSRSAASLISSWFGGNS